MTRITEASLHPCSNTTLTAHWQVPKDGATEEGEGEGEGEDGEGQDEEKEPPLEVRVMAIESNVEALVEDMADCEAVGAALALQVEKHQPHR